MKIIIFGCGQGGQTLGNLLSASVRLLAFADNNPQTWGKEYEGIPVISPAQIPQMDPDLVWIAIKNPAAASSVLSQLQDLGYTGPVQNLSARGNCRAWSTPGRFRPGTEPAVPGKKALSF